MAEKPSTIAPQKEQRLTRPHVLASSPFRMLEQFAEEIDQVFGGLGFGRGWVPAIRESTTWMPRIDVTQRNNELAIRADLPGLHKEDVKVDVTDDAITIQGERRREHDEERDGVYRTERSYGSFFRTVPLPEGAIADQAKATFKDGVLEITMPAPPEHVNRGRRLEISEAAGTKK